MFIVRVCVCVCACVCMSVVKKMVFVIVIVTSNIKFCVYGPNICIYTHTTHNQLQQFRDAMDEGTYYGVQYIPKRLFPEDEEEEDDDEDE